MDGRFWISVAVMFALSLGLGFVVHGVLLHGDYEQLQNLFRSPDEAQGYFAYMLLAHALIALGFTWIYRQGREAGKPWLGQGVRFGIAVAVLMTIPIYLIYYAVQPMPGPVVAKQIAFDVIAVLIMGIAVAWINRPPTAA